MQGSWYFWFLLHFKKEGFSPGLLPLPKGLLKWLHSCMFKSWISLKKWLPMNSMIKNQVYFEFCSRLLLNIFVYKLSRIVLFFFLVPSYFFNFILIIFSIIVYVDVYYFNAYLCIILTSHSFNWNIYQGTTIWMSW